MNKLLVRQITYILFNSMNKTGVFNIKNNTFEKLVTILSHKLKLWFLNIVNKKIKKTI